LIEDNIIRLNRATWNGGGIGIEGGVVRGNLIENNEAENGDGGGIWIWTNLPGLTVVEDNVILNNVAGDHGGGIHSALISLSGLGNTRISGNLIARCSAVGEAGTGTAGGGLFLYGGTQEVWNNTIVFNESPGHASALGGAVSIEKGSPLLERNIIANTLGGAGVYCDPGVTATLRDNLVWNNVGGHSLGDCADWELADGNLEADPVFCDPSSDVFMVARFSPALTHSAGYVGAYPDPGCDAVRVEPLTWGRIKWLSGSH
jgi:predicted outer membrane repeat protein